MGVENTGSSDDLVNRLSELLLFKDVYPKMFKHLKKCGGKLLYLYANARCSYRFAFSSNLILFASALLLQNFLSKHHIR